MLLRAVRGRAGLDAGELVLGARSLAKGVLVQGQVPKASARATQRVLQSPSKEVIPKSHLRSLTAPQALQDRWLTVTRQEIYIFGSQKRDRYLAVTECH